MKIIRSPKNPQDYVSFHIFTTTVYFATPELEKHYIWYEIF